MVSSVTRTPIILPFHARGLTETISKGRLDFSVQCSPSPVALSIRDSQITTFPSLYFYCAETPSLKLLGSGIFLPRRPSRVALSSDNSKAPLFLTCLLAAAATAGECWP